RIDDRIEIAACTQTPVMDRDEVANVLGVAPGQVRIIPTATGGGFGGKLDLSLQPLIAVAAWLLNKPVRCIYSRNESMASTTKRHPALIDMLADRFGQDRLEFRLKNAIRAGDATATGQVLAASAGLAACLEALKPHWRAALARRVPAGPLRRGAGIACMWYGIGNTSLSNPSAMRIGLRPSGRV